MPSSSFENQHTAAVMNRQHTKFGIGTRQDRDIHEKDALSGDELFLSL